MSGRAEFILAITPDFTGVYREMQKFSTMLNQLAGQGAATPEQASTAVAMQRVQAAQNATTKRLTQQGGATAADVAQQGKLIGLSGYLQKALDPTGFNFGTFLNKTFTDMFGTGGSPAIRKAFELAATQQFTGYETRFKGEGGPPPDRAAFASKESLGILRDSPYGEADASRYKQELRKTKASAETEQLGAKYAQDFADLEAQFTRGELSLKKFTAALATLNGLAEANKIQQFPLPARQAGGLGAPTGDRGFSPAEISKMKEEFYAANARAKTGVGTLPLEGASSLESRPNGAIARSDYKGIATDVFVNSEEAQKQIEAERRALTPLASQQQAGMKAIVASIDRQLGIEKQIEQFLAAGLMTTAESNNLLRLDNADKTKIRAINSAQAALDAERTSLVAANMKDLAAINAADLERLSLTEAQVAAIAIDLKNQQRKAFMGQGPVYGPPAPARFTAEQIAKFRAEDIGRTAQNNIIGDPRDKFARGPGATRAPGEEVTPTSQYRRELERMSRDLDAEAKAASDARKLRETEIGKTAQAGTIGGRPAEEVLGTGASARASAQAMQQYALVESAHRAGIIKTLEDRLALELQIEDSGLTTRQLSFLEAGLKKEQLAFVKSSMGTNALIEEADLERLSLTRADAAAMRIKLQGDINSGAAATATAAAAGAGRGGPPLPPRVTNRTPTPPPPGDDGGYLSNVGFGRGFTSTLRYAVPSLLLFGAVRQTMQLVKLANELQLDFKIIENQLGSIGEEQAFGKIKNSILETAKATGQAVEEFAKLAPQIAGAFNDTKIKEFKGLNLGDVVSKQVDSAAKISEVTGLPLKEITDGLTAASLAFGVSFQRIGDVSVKLEQKTGVLSKETVSFLGDVAPVAQEAGYSVEEFGAIAALVQQKSGRSGSSLAENFNRIIPAVTEGKDKLLELAAANEALRTPTFFAAVTNSDVPAVLEEIGKQFDNLDTAAQQEVIQLLGGRREAAALIPVLANYKQLSKLQDDAADSAGTLEERFQAVRSTALNTFQRIAQALKIAGVQIYESGIGAAISDIARSFETLIAGTGPLLTVIGTISSAFGGLPVKILLAVAAMKLMRTVMRSEGAGTLLGNIAAPLYYRVTKPYAEGAAGAAAAGGGRLAQKAGGVKAIGGGLATAAAGINPAAIGIGAAITAYTVINDEMDKQKADIKRLTDKYEKTKKTSQELKALSDRLKTEEGGGENSGWLDGVLSWLNGKKEQTEADIIDIQLFKRGLDKGKEDIFNAVTSVQDKEIAKNLPSDLPEKIIQQQADGIMGAFGIGSAEKNLSTVLRENGVTTGTAGSNKLFAETTFAVGIAPDSGQGLFSERTAKDLRAKSDARFAALGLEYDKVYSSVAAAVLSSAPIEKLQEIKRTGTKEERQQAQETLKAVQGLDDSEIQAIFKDVQTSADILKKKAGKAAEDINVAKANFESGVIGFSAYMKTLLRKTKQLVDIPQKGAELEQKTAQYLREINTFLSNAAKSQLDRGIELENLLGRGDEQSVLTGRLDNVLGTLPTLRTKEDKQGAVTQYIETAKALRQAQIDATDNLEEKARLMNEAIEIPNEIIAAEAQAEIQGIASNYEAFSTIIAKTMGMTADEWVNQTVMAITSGQKTVEDIIADILKRIQTLQAFADNASADIKSHIGRGEKWTNTSRPSGKAAEDNQKELQGWIDTLNSGFLKNIQKFAEGASAGADPAKQEQDAAKLKAQTTKAKNDLEKAQRGNDKVFAAQKDIQNAYADLEAAQKDSPEYFSALAAIANGKRALDEALLSQANSAKKAQAQISEITGNSVEAAAIETQVALDNLNAALATNDTEAQDSAKVNFVQSLIAARDALQKRKRAFVDLLLRIGNKQDDPVAVALADVALAQQNLAQALGVDEQIAAQTALIDAQQAAAKAMQDVRISQFELRKAELLAYEDEVGAANLAVQIAQQQVADAEASGAGAADINNKKAALIGARKAANDTRVSEAQDNYRFLFDMEQITKTEYIQYLESLKSSLAPGTKQFKELERTIKQLKDDISGDLQTNLPTALTLPTLYEVRRLDQTGAAAAASGSGIGYQDNRNMNVQVFVNNGMTQDQIVTTLSDALGTGRNGYQPGIY